MKYLMSYRKPNIVQVCVVDVLYFVLQSTLRHQYVCANGVAFIRALASHVRPLCVVAGDVFLHVLVCPCTLSRPYAGISLSTVGV